MYKALQKIRNVKVGKSVKIFRPGSILPKDYEPPEDYIKNKIVKKIEEKIEKKPVKTIPKKNTKKKGGK